MSTHFETQLKESEQRYRTLVESTPDLITRVDSQGRFTFVNHRAEHYFGIAAQECLGLSAFDFIHPDDRAMTMAAFDRWLKTADRALKFDNRQLGRHGNVHPMQWHIVALRADDGSIIGFDGFARDISDLKRLEQELANHRLHLEALVKQRTLDLENALVAAKRADSAKDRFLANVSHELRTTAPSATPAAADASPAAADRLKLENIDTQAGLSRFADNRQRYYHWLEKFAADAPGYTTEIRRLLAMHEIDPARQAAHAIKGKVGLLGMKRLHEIVSALEAAIRQSEPTGDLLDRMHLCIAELCTEIKAKLPGEGGDA